MKSQGGLNSADLVHEEVDAKTVIIPNLPLIPELSNPLPIKLSALLSPFLSLYTGARSVLSGEST